MKITDLDAINKLLISNKKLSIKMAKKKAINEKISIEYQNYRNKTKR